MAYAGTSFTFIRVSKKRLRKPYVKPPLKKVLRIIFPKFSVPTEEVVEVRRGAKVNAERKFFPGYVLIKMDLTDESWHLVKNTPKVTGFLGGGGKPSPITEAEAQRILNQVQEGVEHPKPSIISKSASRYAWPDRPFASFNGIVEEVDEGKARLKVAV